MKVALYLHVKNEHRLVELINHYMYLGFDHFIIYDDNSDIPVFRMLKMNHFDLSKFSVMNHNYNNSEELRNQRHWANIIIPVLTKKNIDYLLFIDADEILFIKNFTNIKDFINHYSPFDIIYINWVWFGENIRNNDSLSIINTFNKCEEKIWKSGKSLVKVSSLDIQNQDKYICPHSLNIKPNSIHKDINNKVLIGYEEAYHTNMKTKDAPIYLAHYILQDIETFISRKLLTELYLVTYYYNKDFIFYLKKYKSEIIDSVYNNNLNKNNFDYKNDNFLL